VINAIEVAGAELDAVGVSKVGGIRAVASLRGRKCSQISGGGESLTCEGDLRDGHRQATRDE
jgi:hypothetical protein